MDRYTARDRMLRLIVLLILFVRIEEFQPIDSVAPTL
jgi:hypothetical protein